MPPLFGEPGPKQCHPRVGRTRPAHGCLPPEVLEEAATALNLKAAKNPVALRKALEKHLKVDPEKEYSFLQALPFSPVRKAELAKTWLRPKKPDAWKAKPNMWLDSLNIAAVMNQFEEANERFEFMGPFPIDFAAPDPYKKENTQKQCLMNEMCELRVLEAKKNGTDYIGIVYNLDPHFKSGSHWVANFIDLKANTCHYFDSYGMEPPKQVAIFMQWLAKQDPQNPMRLHYNPKRLQYKNTECGMYCLLFNTLMQYGTEFVKIPRSKPSDQEVMNLRDWFYST